MIDWERRRKKSIWTLRQEREINFKNIVILKLNYYRLKTALPDFGRNKWSNWLSVLVDYLILELSKRQKNYNWAYTYDLKKRHPVKNDKTSDNSQAFKIRIGCWLHLEKEKIQVKYKIIMPLSN